MNDEVRLSAHQKNIERYQDLLKTKLSEIEVRYLESAYPRGFPRLRCCRGVSICPECWSRLWDVGPI
jgi:hypothetical protein